MILYLERVGKTLRLMRAATGTALLKTQSLKAGDADTVTVEIRRDGDLEDISGLVEMVVPIKAGFSEEEPLLAVASDWTRLSLGCYEAPLLADVEAMRATLGTRSSLPLVSELTLTDDGGGPVTTPTFTVALANDVWRGEEGTALPLPTPAEWLAAQRAVNLSVLNYTTTDIEIAGVLCPGNSGTAPTLVGSVDPLAIPYVLEGETSLIFPGLQVFAPYADESVFASNAITPYGTMFGIPRPLAGGVNVTIFLE